MLSFVNLVISACILCLYVSADKETMMAGLRATLVKHKSGTVIDVGANGGVEMKLSLQHGFRVIGIECLPRAYHKLAQWFDKEPKAMVLNGCASDTYGIAELHLADDSSSTKKVNIEGWEEALKAKKETRASVSVVQFPLDSVLANVTDIVMIKMDTQGTEPLVLQGLKNILRTHKPVVVYEFYMDTEEIGLTLLKSLGYSCEDVSKGDRLCTVK
jgi:FkbM family methyltransferase